WQSIGDRQMRPPLLRRHGQAHPHDIAHFEFAHRVAARRVEVLMANRQPLRARGLMRGIATESQPHRIVDFAPTGPQLDRPPRLPRPGGGAPCLTRAAAPERAPLNLDCPPAATSTPTLLWRARCA